MNRLPWPLDILVMLVVVAGSVGIIVGLQHCDDERNARHGKAQLDKRRRTWCGLYEARINSYSTELARRGWNEAIASRVLAELEQSNLDLCGGGRRDERADACYFARDARCLSGVARATAYRLIEE